MKPCHFLEKIFLVFLIPLFASGAVLRAQQPPLAPLAGHADIPVLKPHVIPSEEEDDPPAPNASNQSSSPSSNRKEAPGEADGKIPPLPEKVEQVSIDARNVEIQNAEPSSPKKEPKSDDVKDDVKKDSKSETTTDIPKKPDTPELSKSETETLMRQRMILSRVKSPNELLQYLRETWRERNYRAASMAMAFDKTIYATETLRQECLAQWSDIIDRIEGVYPRNFPSFTDRTDRLFRTADSQITLEFVKDSNDCWQLGPQSIARTDEFYNDVRNDPPIHGDWFSKNVPPWMHKVRFGLSYFRWMLLLLTLLFGGVVYWIVQRTLYLLMRAYMHVVYQEVTQQSRAVWRQIGLIAMACVWFYAFKYIVADPKVFGAAYFLFSVFITIMVILIVMKVVDLLSEALRVRILAKNQYSNENVESLIVPFFSRTMKVLVVCGAVAWLAKQFGWPLAAVLSGMGIGGIAIAFAAKETVANLFGSITVMIDRPFEIGDWIETNSVAGTVVSVGMRSTRIQTLDFSTITIPNNNLTTAVINNLGRKRNRRFKTFLTLQYDTPIERIDAFCEGIRELIMKNAFSQKEGFFVGLNQLSDSSIDVLLNMVFVCPSGDTENRERAKMLRNILKLAEAMDVRFAYPTQTLYLDRDHAVEYKPLAGSEPSEIGRAFANRLLYPKQLPENEVKETPTAAND